MLGVGVVLVFLAVSIGLAEVALRTMFDPLRVLDGDAMWEYRWRQTRAAQGSAGDAAPEYPFDVYDAVLGWKPRAGYHRGGVRTNSLGIRAEREFAFERPHGTSRVVIVGNSFMWGEGVANDHTFASRLDDLPPATEVINLGVHGYGTDQQLLRLRELGLRFAPNLVILGFYEENLWRNALSFRDYAKPRFRWVNGAFVLDNQPVPTPEAILAKEQRLPRSYLLVLARRAVRKTWWSWGGLAGSEQWRVTRAILELKRREVEAERARLLLLYIPAPGQDRRGLAEHLLAEWAAEQGVALLNLREQFAALAHEDRSRVYNGHWTPFGNQVAAELVAAFVASHGLALHGARTSPAR